MNIDQYIQKQVQKELANASKSRRLDRRHIDRRVYAIRHCDGLKDIASKIKEKAMSMAEQFKQMDGGQKTAYILAKIAKNVAGFFAIKSAVDIKSKLDELNRDKAILLNTVGKGTGGLATFKSNQIAEKTEQSKKIMLLKQGVKVIVSLITAFIASSKEKAIEAQVSESDAERNYERR